MITITLAQFDEFEKQFMLDHIKNSDYRYGQAFLNAFRNIHDAIDPAECARLWNDRDTTVCRAHVQKWVK